MSTEWKRRKKASKCKYTSSLMHRRICVHTSIAAVVAFDEIKKSFKKKKNKIQNWRVIIFLCLFTERTGALLWSCAKKFRLKKCSCHCPYYPLVVFNSEAIKDSALSLVVAHPTNEFFFFFLCHPFIYNMNNLNANKKWS